MRSPTRSEGASTFSHRRLTLNSISNTLRYFAFMAVAFFLTPYVVNTLGDVLYGIWVVITSFVGYASILELGLQRAVVKLVSEHRASGDSERLNELIDTALVFFLSAGAFTALLLGAGMPLFIGHFVSDLDPSDVSGWVYVLLGINVLTMFLNFVYAGVLYGWQRYHTRNMIDTTAAVINAGLVYLSLPTLGLVGLIAAKTVTDLAILVATAIACKRAFPSMTFRLRGLSHRSIKELFSFGGRIFISSTMARVSTHTQPIIISSLLAAAATTYFAIPRRLVNYAREIHWSMATGFMPAFSDLTRRGEKSLIRDIYLQYSRYILFAMLPVVLMVYIYGPRFIGVWIGADYEAPSRIVLYLLLTTYLIELTQPLLWSLFIGAGRLNAIVAIGTSMSGLTILLSLLLARPMGIDGVALATLISGGLAQVAFTILVCQHLELSFWSMVRQVYVRPFLLTGFVAAVAIPVAPVIGTGSYLGIGLGVLSSLGLYFTLLFLVALTEDERGWVVRRLRGMIRVEGGMR